MGQTQSSKLLHNKQLCSYAISIESQIEFCKYELRGGNFRKYTDKGYSRGGLQAGSYQPLHSGLRNHDGKVIRTHETAVR